MPGVKGNERSATLSFCQNAPFLAAGSVAGAIDLSFSTSSVLEVTVGPRSRCNQLVLDEQRHPF